MEINTKPVRELPWLLQPIFWINSEERLMAQSSKKQIEEHYGELARQNDKPVFFTRVSPVEALGIVGVVLGSILSLFGVTNENNNSRNLGFGIFGIGILSFLVGRIFGTSFKTNEKSTVSANDQKTLTIPLETVAEIELETNPEIEVPPGYRLEYYENEDNYAVLVENLEDLIRETEGERGSTTKINSFSQMPDEIKREQELWLKRTIDIASEKAVELSAESIIALPVNPPLRLEKTKVNNSPNRLALAKVGLLEEVDSDEILLPEERDQSEHLSLVKFGNFKLPGEVEFLTKDTMISRGLIYQASNPPVKIDISEDSNFIGEILRAAMCKLSTEYSTEELASEIALVAAKTMPLSANPISFNSIIRGDYKNPVPISHFLPDVSENESLRENDKLLKSNPSHRAIITALALKRATHTTGGSVFVSVESNYIEGRGFHSWCRFIDHNGKEIIIDPTLEYIGSREKNNPPWIYKNLTNTGKQKIKFDVDIIAARIAQIKYLENNFESTLRRSKEDNDPELIEDWFRGLLICMSEGIPDVNEYARAVVSKNLRENQDLTNGFLGEFIQERYFEEQSRYLMTA